MYTEINESDKRMMDDFYILFVVFSDNTTDKCEVKKDN